MKTIIKEIYGCSICHKNFIYKNDCIEHENNCERKQMHHKRMQKFLEKVKNEKKFKFTGEKKEDIDFDLCCQCQEPMYFVVNSLPFCIYPNCPNYTLPQVPQKQIDFLMEKELENIKENNFSKINKPKKSNAKNKNK